MIYYKVHKRVYADRVSIVVAACDERLLGKKLKSKNGVLDLAAYASFYKGEHATVPEASAVLSKFLEQQKGGQNISFNLVGSETLGVAANFLDVSKAKKIASVPHLQVYSI